MPGGRPIEYKAEEVIPKVREYIDTAEDEERQLTKLSSSEKGYETYEYKLNVKLPSIEGLAFFLKIHRDTIYAWEKLYPEFSDIIGELRAKQAQALINKGLSGEYNPTIAKVLLSKHGYKEGVEADLTTKGEKLNSLSQVPTDELERIAAGSAAGTRQEGTSAAQP